MTNKPWRAVSLAAAGSLLTSLLLPNAVAGADVSTHRAAPQCVWTSSDLPLPPGFTNGVVGDSDGSSNLLAGSVWNDGQDTRRQAVVWENGTPRLLGRYQDWYSTPLADINSSGVAVGSAFEIDFSVALRYRNGAFETLPGPAGSYGASPQAVNRAGTIIGTATHESTNKVVVWPADNPDTPYLLAPATGHAALVAIDESGRTVASTTGKTSYAWSTWGTRAQLAPVQPDWWVHARDIRAGRVVGYSGTEDGAAAAVEWDVTGRVIRTFPGGVDARAVNAEGMVLGVHQDGRRPAVWLDGQLAGLLPQPANSQRFNAHVLTDDGVVFGDYTNSANHIVPARWTCG